MATICNILVVMNRNELNLYGVSRLASRTSNEIPQKRCQMIFRQSNVAYSRSLCLHLSGKIMLFFVKLRFSKKATKFETISHMIQCLLSKCQIKSEIVSIFVAFSERPNSHF